VNAAVLLLDTAARVTALVGLALGVVRLLRRQSAAVRHWVLAVALTCAAALPLLPIVIPAWQRIPVTGGWLATIGAAPSARSLAAEAAPSNESSGPPSLTPATAHRADAAERPASLAMLGWMLTLSWITGLALGLCVLLAGWLRLVWLAARSRPLAHGRWVALSAEMIAELGLRRPVRLLETDHPALLLTWGLVRPKILLPRGARTWPDELCRIVLAHELAHIRRNDWIVQLLAESVRYANWFNPIVWIAATRLRQESEQACDDAVLESGVSGSLYAAHLLNLARAARTASRSWLPAPAMAHYSSLERRIAAMLDDRISRNSMHPVVRVAAIGPLLALTVLLAGVTVFAQSFATLSGSIIDPTNRVLTDTTLVLTNVQTRAKYEVHSDSTGRFEFVGLPAGQYNLEAIRPGFATFKGELTISGQRLQKDIALQVGSIQETLTVRARNPARAIRNQQGASAAPPSPPLPSTTPLARPGRLRSAADNCTPTAAGGNLVPPKKLVDVKPIYPDELAQARVEGVVVLDTHIQPDGTVGEVAVTSSTHPALDAAAIDAVRQWVFTSTLLNCEPIEVKMNVNVAFRAQ
jgi:TonB family protein